MAKLAIGTVEHDAEEQCLFFVALSRARDFLSLSRAERYTKQNSNASKFLTSIERVVPVSRYEGSGASYSDMFHPHPPPVSDRYEERHLSVYTKCPARYRYEVLEQLYGSRFESPYVQFHRCVYSTIRWLEEQRKSGLPTDPPIALSQLASLWEIHGPTGHAFEGFYRAAAEEMVRDMALAITGESAAYDRGEWLVPVAERKVAVTPDRVILAADGTVHVQRIRTGRETKSETGKPIYALLRLGAEAQYPGKPVAVETYYLSSGKRVLVPDDDDEALLSQYAEAIEGIEAGHFEPRPEPRTCPSCQCYFVCRC